MPYSLSQLLSTTTVEEAEADAIGLLDEQGFPATSWQAKSVPRTLVKWFATKYSDLKQTVYSIASSGFLSTATGGWLDLKLESDYDEVRTPAQSTVGTIVLTNTSGGAVTVAVGALWAIDSANHRYTNTTGGVLAAPNGSTLALSWKAESPGAAWNIPNNTIQATLATPIPGVAASNPTIGSTGTWITTAGSDEESDASAAQRGRTKWATLGTGGGGDAYESWARQGAPTVTRVKVDDAQPDGPNSLRVYLANAAGAATGAEVTAADALIQTKRSAAALVTTMAATNVTVTVVAVLYVQATYASTAPAEAIANLTTLQGDLDIGETVYQSEIMTALSSPTGVRRVQLTAPVGDTSVGANGIAVFSATLSTVLV